MFDRENEWKLNPEGQKGVTQYAPAISWRGHKKYDYLPDKAICVGHFAKHRQHNERKEFHIASVFLVTFHTVPGDLEVWPTFKL